MRNIQAKITNLPLTDRSFQTVTKIQSSSTPHLLSPLDMDHWPIDMTEFSDEFFFQTTTKPENHPNMNRNILYQCSVCWVPSLGFRPHESIILIAIAGWCFEPMYHQCTFYPCTSGSFFFGTLHSLTFLDQTPTQKQSHLHLLESFWRVWILSSQAGWSLGPQWPNCINLLSHLGFGSSKFGHLEILMLKFFVLNKTKSFSFPWAGQRITLVEEDTHKQR